MKYLSRRNLKRILQGTDPKEDSWLFDSEGKLACYHAIGDDMHCQKFPYARQVSESIAQALGENEDSQFGPSFLGGSQTELGEPSKDVMVGEILRLQDEVGYANALEQTSDFPQMAVANQLGFQVRHVKTLLKRS